MPLFSHTLRQRAQVTGNWLCVGIDPQPDRLPSGYPPTPAGVLSFCRELVDATAHVATAYKLNFAFFEALGPEGWQTLFALRGSLPAGIPAIADAKRGDIGSTSTAYAHAIFDELNFDAVTLSPYLGWDALEPFMCYEGRALFVLCRTSNPGSRDVQLLDVGGAPLYMEVARQAVRQECAAEIGLVVGGTQPEALRAVRELSEDLLVLVPGIGAQGAVAAEAMKAGANAAGENALMNVSREIARAGSGRDWTAEARAAAERFAAQTTTVHGNR